MTYSESQETVLRRSSGESLKWVPKVQGESHLRISQAKGQRQTFYFFYVCLYPLSEPPINLGDFFVLFFKNFYIKKG